MTHDDIWQVRFRQATRRVQELEEEVARLKASEPKELTDDEIIEIAAQYVETDGWMDGDGILSFARALLTKGE